MSIETPHGFIWDKLTVERVAWIKGHQILVIKTPLQMIEIRSTPTGILRVGKVQKAADPEAPDAA